MNVNKLYKKGYRLTNLFLNFNDHSIQFMVIFDRHTNAQNISSNFSNLFTDYAAFSVTIF